MSVAFSKSFSLRSHSRRCLLGNIASSKTNNVTQQRTWNRNFHCTIVSSQQYGKNNGKASKAITKMHTIGGKEYDDLKQVRLLQLPSSDGQDELKTLASICVKRNIIFHPKLHVDPESEHEILSKGFSKALLPLLRVCLQHASVEGEQPQGLAQLTGLTNYARSALSDDYMVTSPYLDSLLAESTKNDEKKIILDAIYAISMNEVREGSTSIGIGSYCDARDGWTFLAKEYAQYPANHKYCKEGYVVEADSQLFQKMGGNLVSIEYIGNHENPDYWKNSGGAMARFFFL